MAKVTVKSNTASEAFYVEQKVIEFPLKQNRVELLITPKDSYSINSKDFNLGALQSHVKDVKFSNLGDKVVASINIKEGVDVKKDLIIDLPIYAKPLLKLDIFNIKVKESTVGGILINTSSPFEKSTIENETNYTVRNNLGKKVRVFTKKFVVTKDFKFSELPKYTIVGNNKKYKVTVKTCKDKNNNIHSKTFDFYYTSPRKMTDSQDSEITFKAAAKNSSNRALAKEIAAKNQNAIYYIDKGKSVGPQGGLKRMVVRGSPGSAYSFLVSDSNGSMYNTNTGKFSNTGGLITGIIPKEAYGKSYGEAVIKINVPRSAVAKTISTQFLSKEPTEIQKIKMERATNISEINKILGEGKIRKEKVVSLTIPALTFEIWANGSVLTSTSVVAAEAESANTESVTLTVDGTTASDFLLKNKKVYKSDGTLFGTCTSVTNGTTLVFGAGIASAIANDDVLYTYPTQYLGPKVKITDDAGATTTSQAIFIGDENRFSLKVIEPGSYPFSFRASSATDDKLVQITRQPLFVMPKDLEDNYVAWDNTEAKKALAQKADGTAIPSDWDWSSVEEGANIKIAMRARGNGKILKTTAVDGVDKYAYSEVIVEGEISVGNAGRVSASLALNLNNFLSIV